MDDQNYKEIERATKPMVFENTLKYIPVVYLTGMQIHGGAERIEEINQTQLSWLINNIYFCYEGETPIRMVMRKNNTKKPTQISQRARKRREALQYFLPILLE